MMEGSYPPGVSGWMLAQMDGTEYDDLFYPDPACEYCVHYHGDVCTKEWNNLDESYYNPDRDDRYMDDCCDEYEWNGEELDEPKSPVKPKREDYQSERAYKYAYRQYESDLRLYHKWWRKYGRDEE